jgi:hypothetical protein
MKKQLPAVLLLGCAAAFAFGLFQLFKLRFEVGDIYPEYSSLRSDPLGAMIFYESLGNMPRLSVRRDFSSENELPGGKETTYLHLAGSPRDWSSVPEELVQELDGFLGRGGRLVVTFYPETSSAFGRALAFPPTPPPTPTPGKKAGKRSKQEEDRLLRRTSLTKRWGVEFGFVPLDRTAKATYDPTRVVNQSDLELPQTLDWHSGLVLTNLNAAWQTIYARGTNAVLAERHFGAGTVVLATDSYFLSNEAMQKERQPDLLAWLVGPGTHIVFDEAHFGIMDTSGVATLMRKYRLQGLVAALILLAGLFIWKNAMSFAPPYADEQASEEQVLGKDAAAGFVNLLRRNITPKDVLKVCFDEWTKSLLHDRSHSIARVDQAQTILEAEAARAQTSRDPVRAYREIAQALAGPSRPRTG